MSTGFIATAPTSPDEGEITSSPFWPAISLPDLRETVRLDGTITTARLTHAVVDAITSVNLDLSDWRRARQAEGHATLAAVPSEVINNESVHLHSYRRAVYAMTRANLLERYTDYSAGITEQVLNLNPGLATLGPIIPTGTLINMPAAPTQAEQPLIQLWD